MIRNDINATLRQFAKTLSPTEEEKQLISDVYGSLQKLLGVSNCIQIGSFPRFTATTPVHDLDVLYRLGEWRNGDGIYDPDKALIHVRDTIRNDYIAPTGHTFTVELQNHSVVIAFSGKQKLSVDVVPCYSYGKNEYGLPMYKVPHVIKQRNRTLRHQQSWNPLDQNQWISSDPRGYIKQAVDAGVNPDFRKVVKIVKFWKRTLRDINDGLKLKSFHLEQAVTRQFQANGELDLIGALFDFFSELPDLIENPNQIEDRAQEGKYIDDYLVDLTAAQKQQIKRARDMVLIQLEEIDNFKAEDIFTAHEYHRDPKEQFMFDYNHIMLADDKHSFDISYDEQDQYENRAMRRARKKLKLPKKRNLFFKVIDGLEGNLTYFWKVQNSKQLLDKSQRRGEITRHQTARDPETTQYTGEHYVECFGVDVFGQCVRRARCEVAIGVDDD